MKVLRNFKCRDCNTIFEKRIDSDAKVAVCECSGVGDKQLSAPRCFGNTTGKSPSTRY